MAQNPGSHSRFGSEPTGSKPAGDRDPSMADRLKSEGQALKTKAEDGLDEAKAGLTERGEDAKDRAATEIAQTSSALRAAADELEDGSIQHRMFTEAAEAVNSVSDALSNRSIGEIVEDLGRFGRRNPAALVGGAVLAGLVVSRFVKASAADHTSQNGFPPRSSKSGSRYEPPEAAPASAQDAMTAGSGKGTSHG